MVRSSNRVRKPSQKLNSTFHEVLSSPQLKRGPRKPLKPKALQPSIADKALQPVAAKGTSTSQYTGNPLEEGKKYEPMKVTQHCARVYAFTRDPFALFSLFFTPELLASIVTFINSYAGRNHTDKKHKWKPLCVPELYVYLGCVLYMGVRHEKNVEFYWHTKYNT